MGAFMEHIAIITSRLDAQAVDTRQLMQRDALLDHHAPIAIDQPFFSLQDLLVLLHHCSRMAQPHIPPCLHLLLDWSDVEIATLPSTIDHRL
jgi:hypothetical protein